MCVLTRSLRLHYGITLPQTHYINYHLLIAPKPSQQGGGEFAEDARPRCPLRFIASLPVPCAYQVPPFFRFPLFQTCVWFCAGQWNSSRWDWEWTINLCNAIGRWCTVSKCLHRRSSRPAIKPILVEEEINPGQVSLTLSLSFSLSLTHSIYLSPSQSFCLLNNRRVSSAL